MCISSPRVAKCDDSAAPHLISQRVRISSGEVKTVDIDLAGGETSQGSKRVRQGFPTGWKWNTVNLEQSASAVSGRCKQSYLWMCGNKQVTHVASDPSSLICSFNHFNCHLLVIQHHKRLWCDWMVFLCKLCPFPLTGNISFITRSCTLTSLPPRSRLCHF